MPKLTEPQKRVLKRMVQSGAHIEVYIWDDGYWDTTWITSDPRWHRPNIRTMQALERRGLLERKPKGVSSFRFVLTPRGRETAKELLDAEAL